MYEDVTESYVFDPDTHRVLPAEQSLGPQGGSGKIAGSHRAWSLENPPPEMREKLRQLYLDLEADLEARQERSSIRE